MDGKTDIFVTNDHFILWNITNRCNFHCKYCFRLQYSRLLLLSHEKKKKTGVLLDFLRSTKEKWTVRFTGGEPFLYPGFVDLCAKLSSDCLIALDTNLSKRKELRKFVSLIPPERTEFFQISLHIEERERLGLVNEFIEDVLFLKEKGYFFKIIYVLHPSLISRFEKDYLFFLKQGILLEPRPYSGLYSSRQYPESYTRKQLALLRKYNPRYSKLMPFFSKNALCRAGKNFMFIWPDDSISSCLVWGSTPLGNLNKKISPLDELKICPSNRCPCYGRELILDNLRNKFIICNNHLKRLFSKKL